MGLQRVTAALMAAGLCAGMVTATTPALAGRLSASGPVVTSIVVGSDPEGVAVDAVTDKIYVANSGSDSVSVIIGSTDKVIKTIALPSGAAPSGLALDSVTDKIYVAEAGTRCRAGDQRRDQCPGRLDRPAQPFAVTGFDHRRSGDRHDLRGDASAACTRSTAARISGDRSTVACSTISTATVAVNQADRLSRIPPIRSPDAFDDRPGGSELSVNINPISVAPGKWRVLSFPTA